MTGELIEPPRWPAKRWWFLIGLVFATQLGLIFWLGRPQKLVVIPQDIAPSIQLVGIRAGGHPTAADQGDSIESENATTALLALRDPTLFALPHREGFSGKAWLTIRTQEVKPVSWSKPPRSPGLDRAALGDEFRSYMATNQVNTLPEITQPELELKMPLAQLEPFPTESKLRLSGALTGRPLLITPALRSWPSGEILSNSVVQVLVAADGRTISANLVNPPGSGSNEADQQAVREARKTRFKPVAVADPLNPLAGVVLGQMVFEWHTLPLPNTNNPVEPTMPK